MEGVAQKESRVEGVGLVGKLQVEESGEVRPGRLVVEDAIVVVSGWPSLTFVLRALGYRVTTYILKESLIPVLQSMGLIVYPLSRLASANNTVKVTFWTQAENIEELNKILDRFMSTLNKELLSNIVCIIPSRGRQRESVALVNNLKQIHTSHVQHGGITLGRWLILVESSLFEEVRPQINSSTQLRRCFRHIADLTEKGIRYSRLTLNDLDRRKRQRRDTCLYELDDCIKPGIVEVEVIAPSVKQRQILVRRRMSINEMFHAYDLQSLTQDQLREILTSSNLSKAEELDILHSVAKACPEKIVSAVVRSLESVNKIEVGSTRSFEQKGTLSWLIQEEESTLNDEKAARNDDAIIQTQQWDTCLIKGVDFQFQCSLLGLTETQHSPVVCTGLPLTQPHIKLLDKLRGLALRRYQQNVFTSFTAYMRRTYGDTYLEAVVAYHRGQNKKWNNRVKVLAPLLRGKVNADNFIKDLRGGLDAIERAMSSSFWDWDAGSALYFWRWPKVAQMEARDGVEIFVTGKLPRYRERQRWPVDRTQKEAMIKKWSKIVSRGYVERGPVISLTGSFAVPKGETDIRMVYDATKCGLNEVLWSPNFILPTIDDSIRQATQDSWYGDIDLGEQFLNFPLDPTLRPYAGIDITGVKEMLPLDDIATPAESSGRTFLRWNRTLMGLRSSPYNASKMMSWVCDVVRGDREVVSNVFHWSSYRQNCPGQADYDPCRGWGVKWNDLTNAPAADFEIYVDDVRTLGSSERECIGSSRRFASVCNYLGIQDAARKRRFPLQRPSVWCGAKVMSTDQGVFTSTTQEKWDKANEVVNRTMVELNNDVEGKLDRKTLERGRGFLIHLARTYPGLTPFLKGIHLTLETWRGGRDTEGWKYGREDWVQLLSHADDEDFVDWKDLRADRVTSNRDEAPARVVASGRLQRDLEQLITFFKLPKPPLRLIRGTNMKSAIYAFGDASGTGFGATWTEGGVTKFRVGTWGSESQKESSNYRELRNLSETLEKLAEEELNGKEIFLFTDNSTAEWVYYRGSSSSKKLHKLMGAMRYLELKEGCKIHVIHVSGERMKSQGADGFSRGDMLEGVMQQGNILTFVPLHLTAFKRDGGMRLLHWIKGWSSDRGRSPIVLTEEDWFVRGHDIISVVRGENSHLPEPVYDPGTYIWAPAPALAEVAVSELRKARNKWQKATHIFICPRLRTPQWKRHLFRAADLLIEVPPSCTYWPHSNFEPLVLAIFFPFLPFQPWQLRRTSTFIEVERYLLRMWKISDSTQGDFLRKFWDQTRKLHNLPQGVVCRMLQGLSQFGIPYQRSNE